MDKLLLTTDELFEALPGLLEKDGKFPLYVTGFSMRPFLRQNRDIVWLRACSNGSCRRGQILLFQRSNGKLVLHRVRRVLSENRYLMNGDAQTRCEIINGNQILAEVFEIQRGEKRFSCDRFVLRLENLLWHPTKPIRPLIFKVGHSIKKFFRK